LIIFLTAAIISRPLSRDPDGVVSDPGNLKGRNPVGPVVTGPVEGPAVVETGSLYGVRPEPGGWVTSVELEEEGPLVVTEGDVDGPDDSPDVVTPGVTDDDDGGGVPQMQTQPGGLVGAGVVEPGVVDGPDVPGDVEDPDPVVLEPRRYGTRPVLVPVEELCPEVVDGPDVPGVVDGPDVPGDVDELEGSLYGMYPVGAVDDEGDAVVVEGSL